MGFSQVEKFERFNQFVTSNPGIKNLSENEILNVFNLALESGQEKEKPDSLFYQNLWHMYGEYLKDFSHSPQLPEIQLNLGALLWNQGRLEKSKSLFKELTQSFDGSTRFGSLARFYLYQIYYRENQYREALEELQKISKLFFLPITQKDYYQRLAEAEFRIIELESQKGNVNGAIAKLKELLNKNLEKEIKDSLLFHLADLSYINGQKELSCLQLEKLFLQKDNPKLQQSSLYNFFYQGCKASKDKQKEYEEISSNLVNYINWELKEEKKLLLTFSLADLILDSLIHPKIIFENEQIKNWSFSDYYSFCLYLLRNVKSESMDFIAESVDVTLAEKNSSGEKKLLQIKQLYQCYSRQTQIQDCTIPDSSGLENWEKSIWNYLKAVRFSKSIVSEHMEYLDSTRIYLNNIALLNSELSFDGAKSLFEIYLWVADHFSIPDKNYYAQLGLLFLKIQYLEKAQNIISQLGNWENSLAGIELAQSTKNVVFELRQKEKHTFQKKDSLWVELNGMLSQTPRENYSLEREMALKILSEKMAGKAKKDKSIIAKLSYIKSLLHWYYLAQSDSSKDVFYDKEAEVSQDILNFLIWEENEKGNFQWKAFLGKYFHPYLNAGNEVECFNYQNSGGNMACYPLAKNLPSGQNLENFFQQKELYDGYELRKNLAQFHLLCEQQKIRAFKTKLQQF